MSTFTSTEQRLQLTPENNEEMHNFYGSVEKDLKVHWRWDCFVDKRYGRCGMQTKLTILTFLVSQLRIIELRVDFLTCTDDWAWVCSSFRSVDETDEFSVCRKNFSDLFCWDGSI